MSEDGAPAQRLDKWLWFARFCKTRALAAGLCRGRKVRVNRQRIDKPDFRVRPGDVLTFPQGDRIRVVRVAGFAERRGPFAQARLLYVDLDPVGGPPDEGRTDMPGPPA